MTAVATSATAKIAQEELLYRVTLKDKTSRPGLFPKPEERSPQDIYDVTTIWGPEFNGIKIRNFSDSAIHNNELRPWRDTINFSVKTPIDLSREATHVNADGSYTSDIEGLALDLFKDEKLVDTVNDIGRKCRGCDGHLWRQIPFG
ncbi:hypothetical protein L486_05698 [Kwoniella mangroviensis CBS 10435]|uniref:Uncharacterized protein n=1 Tax=Kwoniella mangroviensis CBS 10435 TaxID=1331196 RepID=A0A1B9IMQ9_9TREE|nr:hypothetical protein L486_05698 [Kwoniella mangroviensis CBS 10435]